jgi:hypothetical protein
MPRKVVASGVDRHDVLHSLPTSRRGGDPSVFMDMSAGKRQLWGAQYSRRGGQYAESSECVYGASRGRLGGECDDVA